MDLTVTRHLGESMIVAPNSLKLITWRWRSINQSILVY